MRGKIYELLGNCIPPEIILKVKAATLSLFYGIKLSNVIILLVLLQKLLSELLKKLDSELKHEVCHWAAYYVSVL